MTGLINASNYYLEFIKRYNAKGTINFTNQHIKNLLSFFGNIDLEKIKSNNVYQYIDYLKNKGNSNNTINKKIALLKRIMKHNEITQNDVFKIKKLKETLVTYGILDKNIDINLIIKNCTLKQKIIISLLKDTGIRVNELLNIETKNCDLINRTIFLEKTKTNKTRYVYFTKETKSYLEKYLKNIKSKLLLQNTTISAIECWMRRLRKKYNLKNLSPHRFRHSFSTNLYNNGCDILYISHILGHSSVETTKRYIHTNTKQELSIYDKYMPK